jgi:hypothetical protein
VADEGAEKLWWEVLIKEQGIPVLFVEVVAWYDGRVSSSEILSSVGIALEREPRLTPVWSHDSEDAIDYFIYDISVPEGHTLTAVRERETVVAQLLNIHRYVYYP